MREGFEKSEDRRSKSEGLDLGKAETPDSPRENAKNAKGEQNSELLVFLCGMFSDFGLRVLSAFGFELKFLPPPSSNTQRSKSRYYAHRPIQAADHKCPQLSETAAERLGVLTSVQGPCRDFP